MRNTEEGVQNADEVVPSKVVSSVGIVLSVVITVLGIGGTVFYFLSESYWLGILSTFIWICGLIFFSISWDECYG